VEERAPRRVLIFWASGSLRGRGCGIGALLGPIARKRRPGDGVANKGNVRAWALC
jgi:hypothetical protein